MTSVTDSFCPVVEFGNVFFFFIKFFLSLPLRWEEERYTDGSKWRFLEHKGPVFAPPYERLPENVRFYYDGEYSMVCVCVSSQINHSVSSAVEKRWRDEAELPLPHQSSCLFSTNGTCCIHLAPRHFLTNQSAELNSTVCFFFFFTRTYSGF